VANRRCLLELRFNSSGGGFSQFVATAFASSRRSDCAAL